MEVCFTTTSYIRIYVETNAFANIDNIESRTISRADASVAAVMRECITFAPDKNVNDNYVHHTDRAFESERFYFESNHNSIYHRVCDIIRERNCSINSNYNLKFKWTDFVSNLRFKRQIWFQSPETQSPERLSHPYYEAIRCTIGSIGLNILAGWFKNKLYWRK